MIIHLFVGRQRAKRKYKTIKSESAVANLFSSKNNMKKVPLKSAAGDSEISKTQKPTKLNPLKPLSGQDQIPNLKPVNTPPSEDAPIPPVKPKESDYFLRFIYRRFKIRVRIEKNGIL